MEKPNRFEEISVMRVMAMIMIVAFHSLCFYNGRWAKVNALDISEWHRISNFLDVIDYFKRVINLCKQMNYSEFHSQQFEDYQKKLNDLLAEKQIKA